MARPTTRFGIPFRFRLAVFIGTVACLIVSPFAPTVAEGQSSCLDCTTTGHPNGGSGHYATDQNHPYEIHERGAGAHPNAIYPGSCGAKHPPTCSGGVDGGALYDRATLQVIAAAVSSGDIFRAYDIVHDLPDGSPFHYVPERTAIQVRSCSEGLVAVHIPFGHLVTAEFVAAVAADRASDVAP